MEALFGEVLGEVGVVSAVDGVAPEFVADSAFATTDFVCDACIRPSILAAEEDQRAFLLI